MSEHDTYVWQERRRWHWRCSTCRVTSHAPGYIRRMDADNAESDHWDEPVIDATADWDTGSIGQHAQLDPEPRPEADQ